MGRVVISIDAELGWGFHDLETPPTPRVESGRRGWTTLLAALERYEIPATWAVVGHLMLDSCDRRHVDHPTPAGWFDRERTSWRHRPDLRFAPDLLEAVIDSPVPHEIGSHTFSHVLFGETTREIATAELRRANEIATEWGLDVESLVYPRNDVGHREVLADAGFSAYRGQSPTPDGVRGLAWSAVSEESLLVTPELDEYGLVNVPASLFLFGFEGPARTVVQSVWEDPMVRQAKRGIDEAAHSEGTFHCWLHPNNLVSRRDDQRIQTILEYINRKRAEADLRVETMGEVAREINANPSVAVLSQ